MFPVVACLLILTSAGQSSVPPCCSLTYRATPPFWPLSFLEGLYPPKAALQSCHLSHHVLWCWWCLRPVMTHVHTSSSSCLFPTLLCVSQYTGASESHPPSHRDFTEAMWELAPPFSPLSTSSLVYMRLCRGPTSPALWSLLSISTRTFLYACHFPLPLVPYLYHSYDFSFP